MNEYSFELRAREKLNELRREGIAGQELRRLGISAGPMLPQSAKRPALAILFLGIVLISAVLAVAATAAPLAAGN